MANTINIPKPHLIMGLCLPLAVLLGYLLAEPLESGSIAVVLFVLMVLAVPIMMKWHHPLLVLSWNACINPYFLPGRPYLWMLMSFASLFFAVLNRSVSAKRSFVHVPSITASLLVFTGVVVATAIMTGGFGIRSLGSARYGGKGYFYTLAAVCGYFALSSQRIPAHKAGLYLAMFFLPALTSLISNIAYSAGPGFYFLYELFPVESAAEQAAADYSVTGMVLRFTGLSAASTAVLAFLLARYGIRGIFDLARPWRIALFFLAFLASAGCGFRSVFLLSTLTFFVAFLLEGLWRTRYVPIFFSFAVVMGVLLMSGSEKLPLAVQRTLSFLPIKLDPIAKTSAQNSMEWRLELWRVAVQQVPKYLFRGKGYAIDPNDLFLAQQSAARGFESGSGESLVAGDYHNGPLSLLIPFGIYGMAAFLWFVTAGFRYLYHNYKYGDSRLHHVNKLLLAVFVARTLLFFLVYGAVYYDLFIFTGILGFSASLNGEVRAAVPAEEPVEESFSPFPRGVYVD